MGGLIWMAWVVAITTAPGYGASIALSEVMWNPVGSEHHDEFVEIVNLTDSVWVDLTGWRLGDADEMDALADAGDGLNLPPGAHALVLDGSYAGNSTTYDSLRGRAFFLTIEDRAFGRAGWSNSRPEAVILCSPDGDTVDAFEYVPDAVGGLSWERVDLYAPGGSATWGLSAVAGGTPGRPNSIQSVVAAEAARLEVEQDTFGERLEIAVVLPEPQGVVSLRVYDVEGRLLRHLLRAAPSTRRSVAVWDGTDSDGRQVLPGLYVLVLEASAEGRLWRDRLVVSRRYRH